MNGPAGSRDWVEPSLVSVEDPKNIYIFISFVTLFAALGRVGNSAKFYTPDNSMSYTAVMILIKNI